MSVLNLGYSLFAQSWEKLWDALIGTTLCIMLLVCTYLQYAHLLLDNHLPLAVLSDDLKEKLFIKATNFEFENLTMFFQLGFFIMQGRILIFSFNYILICIGRVSHVM